VIGEAGDLPNPRQSFPWRVLDRILHPIARRRRTAAHRRVLHRQRHTGLVTGVPSDRFQLTDHNRKMLGLDRGPPGPQLKGESGSRDPGPLVERGRRPADTPVAAGDAGPVAAGDAGPVAAGDAGPVAAGDAGPVAAGNLETMHGDPTVRGYRTVHGDPTVRGDPTIEGVSAQDERDEPGDIVGPEPSHLRERDGPSKPTE
jgi:hypothetical protein